MSLHQPFIKKDFSLQVQAEGIRFIYANLLTALPGLIVLPIIIAWAVWDHIPHLTVLIWFMLAFVSIPIRAGLAYRFHHANPTDEQVFRWGRYFTYTALYQGLIYGSSPFFLFAPNVLSAQLLLIVIIVSLVAGSSHVYSYWIECFYALTIPLLSLTAAALALMSEQGYFYLAVACLAYLWLSIALVRRSRQSVLSSIQLRFENAALLKELTLSKDKAEKANARKTRFLAAASHDLRQPVQALSLFTEALSHELKSQKGKQLLGFLEESVDTLRELLSSLLDISKLDAGIVKAEMNHVHLTPIMERQYRHFMPQAKQKSLTFRIKCCQDIWVISDASLLENIIQNLISNAIKYTDTGGILLSCRKRSKHIWIEVRDTGRGISEAEQELVLEEFYQVSNQERNRQQGLGLGLAIVNRQATLLNHSFSILSKLGSGTCARLALPQSAPPKAISKMDRPLNTKEWQTHKNILVIDDESLILEGMITLLESWHYNVFPAQNAAQAFDIVANNQIDVIISDFSLEGMDGLEIISKIRLSQHDEIPAVLITGDTSPERIQRAKQSGLMLLHKPVKPAKLRAAIQLESN